MQIEKLENILEKLENILEKSKKSYIESVSLESANLEDNLFSIMTDAKSAFDDCKNLSLNQIALKKVKRCRKYI